MTEIINIDYNKLHINDGPIGRQLILSRVQKEFDEGNIENSIYYQVCSLYGIVQDRYLNKNTNGTTNDHKKSQKQSNQKHNADDKLNNELLRYIMKEFGDDEENKQKDDYVKEFVNSCNFMQNIEEPKLGYQKIMNVCREFPKEWTIVQVCKSARPQTTYSLFREIHEREDDIYVTILQHARSLEYPEPICLRFSDFMQISMFEKFANISEKCKEYMQVNPKDVNTHEAKLKYWTNLKTLDKIVRDAIDELRAYIFPWIFVFRGLPNARKANGAFVYQKEAFAEVDSLCDEFNLKLRERILLSLAALQVPHLTFLELEAISAELSDQQEIQVAIQTLLQKFQTNLAKSCKSPCAKTDKSTSAQWEHTNYPCILIVDEQLDHLYWEELNVSQEMCRVNSLQCLYKLYKAHQNRIKNGYLQVNFKRGASVINPDGTLVKTAMRMGAFFKYWTPNWPLKLGEKATQEELLDDFFKRDCYIYAGHGSGLQHISGKRISKQNISAVVFLFGCDSTRLTSSGLFSDLIGTHFYYHAAMCPCIIGTILPALDAEMDKVSVEIVSRCVAPESKQTAMWNEINTKLWTKEGVIERLVVDEKTNKDMERASKIYQIPSICGALTTIHARGNESNFYNTIPYVCRGLPAWNCDFQPLPDDI